MVFTSNQKDFNIKYQDYVSSFCVLIETGMWKDFEQALDDDKIEIYVTAEADKIIKKSETFSEILTVSGYKLPIKADGSKGSLHPYQQYALRKALASKDHFLFFNHGTGTGKGTEASAGAQELFNTNMIDLVYVFTLRKMKINLTREFNTKTSLVAKNIEGTKAYRKKEFEKDDAQVFVMNYEKANFDFDLLVQKAKGKRVLFILDEVQKILVFTGGKPNKAGAGIRKLIRSLKSPHIWPMSATVVGKDPERFWRLFDLPVGKNPLGTLSDFRETYSERIEHRQLPWGVEDTYIWSPTALAELRHRIASKMHTVRKTDPGVREYFKKPQFIAVPVQLSDEDRDLYNLVLESARDDSPDKWGQYYRILRYMCNTVESLKFSDSPIAKTISDSIELSSKTSSKMEMVLDKIQEIADASDKVVVFTQFTNLGLFLIADQLKERGIKFVQHYGTGMTDKEAQKAQDDFKADPSITVFLSSDAGSHGLSFQEARYVISYDTPYSYDLLTQRNDRIDRADSYLEGLTTYVYYTESTVEERIWEINNSRRELSSAVQGTVEVLGRSEDENLGYLMFGKKSV